MASGQKHVVCCRSDAGFSLIELLVAVAVLALAAVTMLEHQSQAISMTSQVEQRTLAAIVAENRLALALGYSEQPPSGTRTGQENQLGAEFTWRETVRPAPGGDLIIINVRVTRHDGGAELANLTGYRKAQ